MGTKNPNAPDLGANAAASERIAALNEQIASEQLAWARDQQVKNQGLMDEVLGVTRQVAGSALSGAQADQESFASTFRPMEKAFAEDAQGYDTPERRARAAAEAITGVTSQFDAQRRNALQRLEGYGVDPSQTRNAALDIGVRTAQAAAQAQAATAARNRVEDTGRAFRGQAIQLGQQVANRGMQQADQARATAGQGQQQALQTSQVNAALPGTSLPFSQTALAGQQQGANIRLGQYEAQKAAGDQAWGQVMDVAELATDVIPFADGGPVVGPGEAVSTGGVVVDPTGRSNGTGIDDQVAIRVSSDEYVIPADVVRYKGTEFFDKLVAKHHTPAAQQAVPVAG